jgi:hypothetical protein
MNKLPIGHVTVWQMTESERLAYIEKHPIVPTKRDVIPGSKKDYKWRSKQAVESRYAKKVGEIL